MREHATIPDAPSPSDLAHLITAALDAVDARLRAAHDALSEAQHDTAAPWHPTFVGKWLARSLEMRVPLPAPRRIHPGPRARAHVLDAVITTHRALVSLMTGATHADWSRERMVSPLNAIVRVNFGDACVIVLRHSERHAAQIEALAEQLAPEDATRRRKR